MAQHAALRRKLAGHFNYFAISGNKRSVSTLQDRVQQIWFKWLNRRSQRSRMTWQRFTDLLKVHPFADPPSDDTNLDVVWIDVGLGDGTRLERLKSAPFGGEGLILLAWAEVTGSGGFRGNVELTFYTMIVDPSGAVAREKTALGAGLSFTAGDDIVAGPGGGAYWSVSSESGISVVSFIPG
jgi:hypothetical protein